VGSVSSTANVDVRQYVLPKFKLDVTFDKPYYRPGSAVKCVVTGRYFFGQPVAGGALQTEVRSEEPGRPVLDKRTVTLGADGTAAIDFTLPARLAGRPQDGGAARFTLTAVLTDTAGQESGRTVSRLITAQDLHVEAIPEGGPLVPGLDNLIYLYVTTPDGTPVKATVSVVYGEQRKEVTTSDLGAAVVGVKPDPAADRVVLTARASDGKTGSRSVRPDVDINGNFLVRTDRAVYDAGQTMTVSVLGSGQQPVFVDLIRDGQTIRTETIELADGKGAAAFDLPAELAGTLELCAYRITGDGLPVRKMRTLVVRPPEGLRIKMKANKPEYRPGESARLKFELTDAEGRPAPGALSLAAVDEAVFAVLQQRPGLEQAFYLLEQELLQPVATLYPWSPFAPLPPADRDLFEMALFSATARTLDPVLASAGAVKSPHTLTLTSLPGKIDAFQRTRSSRLEQVIRLWIALGIAGLFAGYVGLCQLIGTFRVLAATAFLGALGVGTLLLPHQMRERMFDAVGMALPEPDARFGMAKDSPKAEAFWEAKSGGAEDAPLRVRDRFPETLLWKPELITDDAGNAELEVPLADSITTWRMTASAVAADGRLGAMQSGVRVFQPFFVDLDLPVALTRNDKVAVPVVVSNFLDLPQTVTVTLADLPWAKREGEATLTVELPPRAVRSVKFPLTITKAGRHTLEVTARGQGVADAVRRPITIVPDGRPVELVQSGSLDRPASLDVPLPADMIPDSASLLIRLYPSTFSQLLDGLDAIFRMPYGCFEQTSSTTYPNILALDYIKRTGQAKPEIEAKARQYIALGYQRLVGFEVPGGGFDWYGRAPADVTLSAYGLMQFTDMARVHDVDPELIRRTRAWLLKQRDADGSWKPGRFHAAGAATVGSTAYVARAVFSGSDDLHAAATRDFLLRHAPESIDDPYTLALVADALRATQADPATIDKYLERLLFQKKSSEDGKQIWWEQPKDRRTCFYASGRSADIEATALTVQVLIRLGKHGSVSKAALGWLIAQKDPSGTWHSTQATVLALQALTMATTGKLDGDRDRSFTIRLGDETRTLAVPRDQSEVVQRVDLSTALKTGTNTVTIEELSGTGSGFQIVARHHVPGAAPAPPPAQLEVGVKYDRSQITVGDALRATATLRNTGTKVAPMVMLDLPIPGGFAIDSNDFHALVRANRIDKFQVTPRQVIIYLRALEPGQSVELGYRLRATMPVEVSADAARAYEYYDPDRRATGGATRLTAVER
jgi:uncharacterized protein YfaS (alpha-2-macroglobulin family)